MNLHVAAEKVAPEFFARDIRFPLDSKVLIMGVLNVTPDSFSDGGHYVDPAKALDHVQRMAEEGADIIDVGGESTRPGAAPVDEEEEMKRLKPILQVLGRRNPVPISVDTRKAAVAQLALDCGAAMVNDVSALRDDPEMGRVVAEAGAGVVLMHRQGDSRTMQQAPSYRDVIGEIKQFLTERLSAACEQGIKSRNILLDPGVGFGKNVSHNLTIINRLDQFLNLGRPLIIGISKKSFIGQILEKPVEERYMGTGAAVAVAVLRGAHLIRVHDVALMRDVAKMAKALREA
ncbi:MAG: dihydropteroate synthase [Nitrospirota bacterium]|nr:MAG: dihydropteroate synthase [Nitrospirota bacterium]